MDEAVDASPPVDLDMRLDPDAPPDVEVDPDMSAPRDADMHAEEDLPPAPCAPACTEGFVCTQGECVGERGETLQIELEPLEDGGQVSRQPPASATRITQEGDMPSLGVLSESESPDLRTAHCSAGELMVGAQLGFGIDNPGQGIEVLRRFVPLCQQLGFEDPRAGQRAVALGSVRQGSGFEEGASSTITIEETLQCEPDQVLTGISSESFTFSFFAMDLTLHCAQLELDASGRLVIGSRGELLPANAGACRDGLKALEDEASTPMCRTLGGTCPDAAPAISAMRTIASGDNEYRRPDAWQSTCRSLSLRAAP